MKNEEQLLPVGSVVYLEGGTLKLVILARGQLVSTTDEGSKQVYFDYLGSLYPQGFDVENTYYFNQEDIKDVVFTGYQNDDETKYLEMLKDWTEEQKNTFARGKTKEQKVEKRD